MQVIQFSFPDLRDSKISAFSIFANRRIHLEKSRRSELQKSPGLGRGEKLDKMEAACDSQEWAFSRRHDWK